MCEQPYLKQRHVLLVVLLALLGGCIAAVDEGAALLRVAVTCDKQTPPVRRLTHRSRLVLHLPRVGRVAQLARHDKMERNCCSIFLLRNTRRAKGLGHNGHPSVQEASPISISPAIPHRGLILEGGHGISGAGDYLSDAPRLDH